MGGLAPLSTLVQIAGQCAHLRPMHAIVELVIRITNG